MIVKANTVAAVECTHCGLPVPAGLIVTNQETQFCCGGCQAAYHLIHESGLDSFYQMTETGDSMTLKHRSVNDSRFAEFDSPSFLETFAMKRGDGENQIQLALDGIHCAACIWLIEKLPGIVPGVAEARVNWSKGTVRIRWEDSQTQLSSIAHALHRLGYTPHPIRASEKEQRFQQENRRHLSRLGIAAALAGNNMIISAALYFGMFSHMTAGMTTLMRVSSCLIGLVALLVPGRVFLQSAVAALRTRTPHMDLPIALALLVGTIIGTVNVFRGSGEVYFDSLSVLIVLLLIGRWLQYRQQAKAADAVELLYRMTPRTATKIVNGEPVETLVELVEVGDLLQVKAGELIPADGLIESGSTRVDESILTGESAAVLKQGQDEVFAGTLNQSSRIMFIATAVGDATRLSRIGQLVEASGASRPEIVKWANRIGGYFVVALLLVSLATFLYWLPYELEIATDRTMALLIVACPCALALATPLAIAVALGRAAKDKVLIKSGDVLQWLQQPGMIWLDKTGTITEGCLQVEAWYGDREILPWVESAERESNHPVARALVAFAKASAGVASADGNAPAEERGLPEPRHPIESPPSHVEEILGLGLVAQFPSVRLLVGKRDLLKQHGIEVSANAERQAKQIVEAGFSPCWVVVDDEVASIAAVGDAVRPESMKAISQLRLAGWKVGVLSGDHQQVVDRVAKRLEIRPEFAIGNLSPEEKLARVQQTSNAMTTVMVGDGVNDSAALAAATVGIAVKGGTEASLAAAPVYLAKPGLLPILDLMNYSRATTRVMNRNFAISLSYNLVFAGLAFSGFINPLVAAILMPLSSLTVVSMSLTGRASANRSGVES